RGTSRAGRVRGQTAAQRAAGPCRSSAPAIEADGGLGKLACQPGRGDPVDDRCERAAPAGYFVDVAEGAGLERGSMRAPVGGEELALVAADVDVDGALALAGPALQAQIEDSADSIVVEPGLVHAPVQRQAKH